MTNVYTNASLLHLVADLSRDPDVRDRLTQNPNAVIEEYQISPATRDLVRAGDTEKLVAVVASEAREVMARLRDRPMMAMMPWAGGIVSVTSCSPDSGTTGAALTVEVAGTRFAPDARLCFSTAPDVEVYATGTKVHTDSEGNSTITGTIKLAVAGTYDVSVTNPDNETGILPAAFVAY